MYSILVKRALVTALFISPLAACAIAPDNFSPAANNGNLCSSSSSNQSNVEVHYAETAPGWKTDNSSGALEEMICDMFPA